MRERLLNWFLALLAVALAVGMLYLILLDVWKTHFEVKPTVARQEPAVATGVYTDDLKDRHSAADAIPHDRGHGLCGPTPTAETHRALYRWRDDTGTLNLSDKPPASESYDRSVYALDWAEGAFQFDVRAYNSPNTPLPVDFTSTVRTTTNGVMRSLSQLAGQKELIPVNLELTVYASKEQYDREARHGKAGSSGIYSTGSGKAAMYLQSTPGRTFHVAMHETTHALNCNLFGLTPSWLNEGLAEYFAKMTTKDSLGRVRTTKHEVQVARRHAKSGVRRMLSTVHAEHDAFWDMREENYPLAASFVFYLLDSDERRELFSRYLQRLANRRGSERYMMEPEGAFLKYLDGNYPGGSAAALSQWQSWALQAREREHTWRW